MTLPRFTNSRRFRGHLHAARQRRRAAQEETRFDSLVETPADLGSAAAGGSLAPQEMLGSMPVAISFDSAITSGEITVSTSDGRTLLTPDLAADEVYPLGFIEKDVELTINREGAPAGTVSLYVLDNWRRALLIATGVFS